MLTNNFNEKCHYTYIYGNKIMDDDQRLSNHAVKFSCNKKVQQTLSVLFQTTIYLGSTAAPASALPPEAGDFAAAAAAGTEQTVPTLGTVAGTENVAIYAANKDLGVHNLLNGVNNMPNQRYHQNMHFEHQPLGKLVVAYRFPKPPQSPVGQSINTGICVAALSYICFQGYWVNPIFA